MRAELPRDKPIKEQRQQQLSLSETKTKQHDSTFGKTNLSNKLFTNNALGFIILRFRLNNWMEMENSYQNTMDTFAGCSERCRRCCVVTVGRRQAKHWWWVCFKLRNRNFNCHFDLEIEMEKNQLIMKWLEEWRDVAKQGHSKLEFVYGKVSLFTISTNLLTNAFCLCG